MYKLCFYVPKSHLEEVKTALFSLGAGSIGNYEACCWQTLGRGQFCPNDESSPFVGDKGKLEVLEEYKVEMVCGGDLIKPAVALLKETHPYEEPAYDVWPLADF